MHISRSIFYDIIFKPSVGVLNTIVEGTVSQISFLGPRSNFIQFRKLSFQKLLQYSEFHSIGLTQFSKLTSNILQLGDVFSIHVADCYVYKV